MSKPDEPTRLIGATKKEAAKFRALVKPLVLEMHRRGLVRIEIGKCGNQIHMKMWPATTNEGGG